MCMSAVSTSLVPYATLFRSSGCRGVVMGQRLRGVIELGQGGQRPLQQLVEQIADGAGDLDAGRLRTTSRARLRGDHQFLADNADRKSTRLNSSHVAISYAVL